MDYELCLKACIDDARERGASEDIAHYNSYPTPDGVEWAECLEVVRQANEDVTNPLTCMSQYELRLAKRGIPTILVKFVHELREAARKAGVPEDHIDDAITLFVKMRDSHN